MNWKKDLRKRIVSDIEEEISAIDFVNEGREPEQTEDDFNNGNEDFGVLLVTSSSER